MRRLRTLLGYARPGYDGTGQTYLRGLQTTDANGQVTFSTIFPGWYAGRATHIHVDVYRGSSLLKTTQVAFPESISAAVYGTGVYAPKGQNPTTNARDNVFSDGTSTDGDRQRERDERLHCHADHRRGGMMPP